MRLVTKREVDFVKRNRSYTNDNFCYINILLFNLVLKGIVDFELLTLDEKKALVQILENKHQMFRFDDRLNQIVYRK